jgi:hypothetical protein
VDIHWQKPDPPSHIQRYVCTTKQINVIIIIIIIYEYMKVCTYAWVYVCMSLTQVAAQFQALF